jgi:copper chaperone CopZ
VSFQKKEAVVTFDPAQVRVEQMLEAVRRAGYRASLNSPGPRPTPPPQ